MEWTIVVREDSVDLNYDLVLSSQSLLRTDGFECGRALENYTLHFNEVDWVRVAGEYRFIDFLAAIVDEKIVSQFSRNDSKFDFYLWWDHSTNENPFRIAVSEEDLTPHRIIVRMTPSEVIAFMEQKRDEWTVMNYISGNIPFFRSTNFWINIQ